MSTYDPFALERQQEERFTNTLFSDMKEILCHLEDPKITDIYVLHKGEIIIKKFGEGKIFTGQFISPAIVKRMILATATLVDKKIGEHSFPKLEATLPKYNARITGLLPPLTLRPQIVIRKPPAEIFTLEKYVEENRMRQDQCSLILDYIKARKNILIGGGTGSGKTTLLNAIIKKMCELTPHDNFYIVEDVPEIQCDAHMMTPVCVDPHDAAEAVRTALRWNPDRIIFGELRYGEVVNELLKGWNTGHTGNATTIHADNCTSMLLRVRSLLREVIIGELPALSESIHLCVHLTYKANFGPIVDEVLPTNGMDTDNFITLLEKNNLG